MMTLTTRYDSAPAMIINHASLDYQFCQNNDMHNITTKLRMESKLKRVIIFKGPLELEDVLKKKKGETGRVTKMLHESPDLQDPASSQPCTYHMLPCDPKDTKTGTILLLST